MNREEKIKKIIENRYRTRRLNLLNALGLPRPMEITVLKVLEAKGETAVSGIAKEIKTTVPNVSRAVKQMEKEGKVIRIADSKDLRSTLVKITGFGSEYLEKSVAAYVDFMYKALDRLSDSDVDDCLRVSEKLYAAYNEELAARNLIHN